MSPGFSIITQQYVTSVNSYSKLNKTAQMMKHMKNSRIIINYEIIAI